ncbi:MAG TPA: hypothetical protein DCS44_07905 [Cyanobacteria bacterium UBA10660]|nr:MAG TPA: hypothetical protein CPT83_02660 [Candidatus Gastranaerophilales bacterium HUM_1]HAS94521.1 hypothetical protein [Cyanobacteria bacterium UBA10660]
MQNFRQNASSFNTARTSILTELSGGNAELGEAFALIINDMVMQSGITNPKAEPFEVVPESWRKLAAKENKTPAEIKQLDETLKEEIQSLAESYLLFMAKESRNLTGKLDYNQYESFMLKYRFGHYNVMNRPDYMAKVKAQLKTAFDKISAHGESTGGDRLIDKSDMSAFVYAITTKSRRDENNKFLGFEINGIIEPEEYAVSEKQLFENEDNLFSVKLRTAYKILNNTL